MTNLLLGIQDGLPHGRVLDLSLVVTLGGSAALMNLHRQAEKVREGVVHLLSLGEAGSHGGLKFAELARQVTLDVVVVLGIGVPVRADEEIDDVVHSRYVRSHMSVIE